MFSVKSCTVDPAELVYTCNWAYTNLDGSVSGVHKLIQPAEGDVVVPLAEVTEEVIVGWLTDQLTNTAEEFDAHIAKEKEAREKREALTEISFVAPDEEVEG